MRFGSCHRHASDQGRDNAQMDLHRVDRNSPRFLFITAKRLVRQEAIFAKGFE